MSIASRSPHEASNLNVMCVWNVRTRFLFSFCFSDGLNPFFDAVLKDWFFRQLPDGEN